MFWFIVHYCPIAHNISWIMFIFSTAIGCSWIMESLCLFHRLYNLLLGLNQPRVPVPWMVFLLLPCVDIWQVSCIAVFLKEIHKYCNTHHWNVISLPTVDIVKMKWESPHLDDICLAECTWIYNIFSNIFYWVHMCQSVTMQYEKHKNVGFICFNILGGSM